MNIVLTLAITLISLTNLYIVTSSLGIAEFGKAVIVQNFLNLIVLILIPRLNELAAEIFTSEFATHLIITTILVLVPIYVLAISITVLAMKLMIDETIFVFENFTSYIILVVFVLPLGQASSMFLRIKEYHIKAKLPEVATVIITLILCVTHIHFDTLTMTKYLLIWSFSILLGFVTSIILVLQVQSLKFSMKKLKSHFEFSNLNQIVRLLKRYYVVGVLKALNEFLIPNLLAQSAPSSSVAVYELAKKICRPLPIIIGSINQVLFPNLIRRDVNLKKLADSVQLFTILSISIIAILSFVSFSSVTFTFTQEVSIIFQCCILFIILHLINAIGLPFYALAVKFDKVWLRNKLNFIKILFMGLTMVVLGTAADAKLAIIIMAMGSLFIRLTFDLPMFNNYLRSK
jgi:O-antigen/teichoic acid export membrane protein